MTSKRKKLEKIIHHGEEVGLSAPADVLLSMARQDAKAMIDGLKIDVNIKAEDLPIFTLTALRKPVIGDRSLTVLLMLSSCSSFGSMQIS